MLRDTPYLESILGVSRICCNNAVNVAIGYSLFFLNFGYQPLVPSFLMHSEGMSSLLEVVQIIVDQMKTTLDKAQANLTIAQSQGKSQVYRLRHDEMFEVGDEVVLSTCNISVNQHLPSKLWGN